MLVSPGQVTTFWLYHLGLAFKCWLDFLVQIHYVMVRTCHWLYIQVQSTHYDCWTNEMVFDMIHQVMCAFPQNGPNRISLATQLTPYTMVASTHQLLTTLTRCWLGDWHHDGWLTANYISLLVRQGNPILPNEWLPKGWLDKNAIDSLVLDYIKRLGLARH